MALLHKAVLTPSKLELLKGWLPRQAWFVGAAGGPGAGGADARVADVSTEALVVVGSYRFDDPAGEVGIETILLQAGEGDAAGPVLQIPVTYRAEPLDGAADWLIGTVDHSVLGTRWVYDACGDPVYAAVLGSVILSGGSHVEQHWVIDGETVVKPLNTFVEGTGGGALLGAAVAEGGVTDGGASDGAAGGEDMLGGDGGESAGGGASAGAGGGGAAGGASGDRGADGYQGGSAGSAVSAGAGAGEPAAIDSVETGAEVTLIRAGDLVLEVVRRVTGAGALTAAEAASAARADAAAAVAGTSALLLGRWPGEPEPRLLASATTTATATATTTTTTTTTTTASATTTTTASASSATGTDAPSSTDAPTGTAAGGAESTLA